MAFVYSVVTYADTLDTAFNNKKKAKVSMDEAFFGNQGRNFRVIDEENPKLSYTFETEKDANDFAQGYADQKLQPGFYEKFQLPYANAAERAGAEAARKAGAN